jgi:hypothetical protein
MSMFNIFRMRRRHHSGFVNLPPLVVAGGGVKDGKETLDDLLKEKFYSVTFEPSVDKSKPDIIMCRIVYYPDGQPGGEMEISPFKGVFARAGKISIFGEGRSVSEAFSQTVQKLDAYLETVRK